MAFGSNIIVELIYRLEITKAKYQLGQISKEEYENEVGLYEAIYDQFLLPLKTAGGLMDDA